MTLSSLIQPDRGQKAVDVHVLDADGWPGWLAAQPPRVRTLVAAQQVKGDAGTVMIVPGDGAEDWTALAVVKDATAPGPWCLAKLAATLPAGTYRLKGAPAGAAALGWLLAQHRFERYRKAREGVGERVLLSDDPAHIDDVVRIAQATALVRDLVDTGAGDLGPAELADTVASVGARYGATLSVTAGEALRSGFPMIHAVGRAATDHRQPRLIELEWGDASHPRIAIVGKGVCFDSGGLDIKPSAGMRLMKKDMGGAAHALALAELVMATRLPVRLHLLIPAVENAVSADSFRPGDVLHARDGTTIENTNTDAEGRLVLADALVKAAEASPELILDFATLTGAARVALGPDLPATFVNDDALASALVDAADDVHDPLWRMPLWDGYDAMLKSDVADMVNAPDGGFAGAITAALFLRRFVPKGTPWAHLDTFAWRPSAKPGRPKGGEAYGLRAAWEMLRRRYR